MSNFGLLKRSRKTKKSKSMDDLSSNQIAVLSDSQKSILANALGKSKEKRSCPSTPLLKKDGRKGIPQIRSDNNLVYMAYTPNRLSVDSMNHAAGNHLGAASSAASLRKSYSFAETVREKSRMQQEGPPKKKYFKRFEKIFRSVVGHETLYSCYSCSLYQDSIATGHIYLTFAWFCFYSNFMGRQRQIVIDVNKILSITQERTAKIIPNAIKITTETDSYLFSSFISRDRAYRSLVSVWRKSEPQLSCEESDLSDVESMTRIAAFPGYADLPSIKVRSTFEDSTSETSIPDVDTEPCTAPESVSELIDFTASLDREEPVIVAEAEEATTVRQETKHTATDVNNLECTQWKVWQKAEKSLLSIHSLVRWCGFQTLFGDGHSLYTALIIGTTILAVMTFYLGLRMFFFEKEQMEYMLQKRVQLHNADIQYRMEASLALNHRLLSQITEVLSAIHKLVLENSFTCCNHVP